MGMVVTCGVVELAAAALAALGRFCRLAHILLRITIKLLFALHAAEVIRLPFVLGSSSGRSFFDIHAAHRILHSGCALHNHLSFIRELWLEGCSNGDGLASHCGRIKQGRHMINVRAATSQRSHDDAIWQRHGTESHRGKKRGGHGCA